ncbi:MAG: hypothetical protein K6G50_08390 [bacterium]|nr:hypothetical protein [bacterium]
MRRTKILVSFVFFIALASSAWAWSSADWLVSFTVPSGWRVGKISESSCSFFPHDIKGYISVITQKTAEKSLTQSNMSAHRKEVLDAVKAIEQTDVIAEQLVTVNGRTALKLTCMWPDSNQKVVTYSTINNNRIYLFMISCDNNRSDEFLAIFEQFISSVRFLNP